MAQRISAGIWGTLINAWKVESVSAVMRSWGPPSYPMPFCDGSPCWRFFEAIVNFSRNRILWYQKPIAKLSRRKSASLITELNLHSYFSGYNGSLRFLRVSAILERRWQEMEKVRRLLVDWCGPATPQHHSGLCANIKLYPTHFWTPPFSLIICVGNCSRKQSIKVVAMVRSACDENIAVCHSLVTLSATKGLTM